MIFYHTTSNDQQQQQKTVNDSRKKPDRSIELFEEVIEALPCMRRLSKKPAGSIIARKRADQSDQRINDILRLEGTRRNKIKHTVENKLFRGCAQRSLALQYCEHQVRMGENTRVTELCHTLSQPNPDQKILHKRRGGKVKSWIHSHLKFSKEDDNLIVLAINNGIKQLVIEELVQRRLEQAESPLNASGISALTALTMRTFKALRLEDIPSFTHLLFKIPSTNILSGDQLEADGDRSQISPVMLICNYSFWFTQFQKKYDREFPKPTLGPPCDNPRNNFVESEAQIKKFLRLASFFWRRN
jgi:hypothetical protein